MEQAIGGIVIALFSAVLGGFIGATRGQTQMKIDQVRVEERMAALRTHVDQRFDDVREDVKDLSALMRGWMRRESKEQERE